jgi:4,5-dihydroxyphthalate decarboxylase
VLTLSMTCGPYDRAHALINRSVKPKGIELVIAVNHDDIDRQRQAARGDFDICEFFIGTYLADLPFKKLDFTAIPIFVKRMFRHSYIYINRNAGIRSPKDLDGKRVGMQTWMTSAALWAKGMLEDDYGVDLASIQWVAWQEVGIPEWKKPDWLNLDTSRAGIEQFDLLAKGEIDAAITTEIWAPNRHPDIDFLFPDYGTREREYFKRTRCFPIMHTLLIRNFVLKQNPWVARSVYDAWEASKQMLYRQQQEWESIHKTSLWYRALWEEERAAAGDDFYVWGFAKTRHEVDVMLRYAHQQAVTPHRFQPEDLFWPSTLET